MHAFNRCSSMKEITIPQLETIIENNCSSLTQVSIQSSLISIGFRAFSGCKSLVNISIPSTVVSIGYNAFEGCDWLMQIYILSWHKKAEITIYKKIFKAILGVEKTCILKRYIEGKFIDDVFPTTIEFSLQSKIIEGINCIYQIYDTLGKSRYRFVVHSFYISADLAVIVFNLT